MALYKYVPTQLCSRKQDTKSFCKHATALYFYFLFQNWTLIWKDFATCSYSSNGQEHCNCTARFSHSTHFCQISAYEKFQQQNCGLQHTVKPEGFLNAPCTSLCAMLSTANQHSSFEQQRSWNVPKNKQSCQWMWASLPLLHIRFLYGTPRQPYKGILWENTTKQNTSLFWTVLHSLELNTCFPSPCHKREKRTCLLIVFALFCSCPR